MTVLGLARLKAALDPGAIAWEFPRPDTQRLFNGRLRKVERPITTKERR